MGRDREEYSRPRKTAVRELQVSRFLELRVRDGSWSGQQRV